MLPVQFDRAFGIGERIDRRLGDTTGDADGKVWILVERALHGGERIVGIAAPIVANEFAQFQAIVLEHGLCRRPIEQAVDLLRLHRFDRRSAEAERHQIYVLRWIKAVGAQEIVEIGDAAGGEAEHADGLALQIFYRFDGAIGIDGDRPVDDAIAHDDAHWQVVLGVGLHDDAGVHLGEVGIVGDHLLQRLQRGADRHQLDVIAFRFPIAQGDRQREHRIADVEDGGADRDAHFLQGLGLLRAERSRGERQQRCQNDGRFSYCTGKQHAGPLIAMAGSEPETEIFEMPENVFSKPRAKPARCVASRARVSDWLRKTASREPY